jgi:hypothetical protein
VSTDQVTQARLALSEAIRRGSTRKKCLRVWSRFIRIRDAYRCVICGSTDGLNAHHVVRKVTFRRSELETGNGITLCRDCHREPHRVFNRRPDPTLPLNAEGGDDTDVSGAFYRALYEDGVTRGLGLDENYFISDHLLSSFARFRGLGTDFQIEGPRIWMAYIIWRQSDRHVMRALLKANGFDLPEGLVQTGDMHITLILVVVFQSPSSGGARPPDG